jgi:hypothetical protein
MEKRQQSLAGSHFHGPQFPSAVCRRLIKSCLHPRVVDLSSSRGGEHCPVPCVSVVFGILTLPFCGVACDRRNDQLALGVPDLRTIWRHIGLNSQETAEPSEWVQGDLQFSSGVSDCALEFSSDFSLLILTTPGSPSTIRSSSTKPHNSPHSKVPSTKQRQLMKMKMISLRSLTCSEVISFQTISSSLFQTDLKSSVLSPA